MHVNYEDEGMVKVELVVLVAVAWRIFNALYIYSTQIFYGTMNVLPKNSIYAIDVSPRNRLMGNNTFN